MKRCMILAVVLTAARIAAAEMYIGAHYAAGISTIYFLPHTGETWRIAPYDAGVVWRYYADIEHHKYFNIGLQAELNFAARRYRFLDKVPREEADADGNPIVDTINTKHYSQVVELPIVMQWQIPVTQNFCLYINGLMYAAYYARNTAYYTDKDGQNVEKKFNYANWNNFDFGIGGGLGVGYRVGSYEIGVDARFMMGISELYPQSPRRYESLPQQFLLNVSVVRRVK